MESSLDEMRDFLYSQIWRDINSELLIWLEDIRTKLEIEESHDEMCRFQGRAEVVRRLARLPEDMISILQMEANRGRSE